MIQPINGINFNNYSQKTNFKAKVPFTGFYDPHCVSRVGDAKVLTLGEELKHEFKPLFDPIINALKVKDTNNIVSQNGETLFHTMPDGNLIPISLKELKDTATDKIIQNSGNDLSDITAASANQTVIHHLLPDEMTVIDIPVKTSSELENMADTVSQHSSGSVIAGEIDSSDDGGSFDDVLDNIGV